jgi:ATP-dependent Clp protease ATP-binding subunit ClpC
MFDRYTERARRVVYLAEALAQAGRHAQAGTGHLLLAIMYEHESSAARALARFGLTRDGVADAVCAILRDAPASPWATTTMPFSPRLHSVLQDAAAEAISDGNASVGTGHLLLSLVLDRDPPDGCGGYRGTAVEVLSLLGADTAAVRDTMITIMDGGEDHDAGVPVESGKRDTDDILTEILLRIGRLERDLGEHCGEAHVIQRKLGLVGDSDGG